MGLRVSGWEERLRKPATGRRLTWLGLILGIGASLLLVLAGQYVGGIVVIAVVAPLALATTFLRLS